MFDFLESMMIGTELEAHGKKYTQLGVLRDGYYLASEKDAPCPAPVVVIYVEPKATNSSEE